MKYRKKIMSRKDLIKECGYTRAYLDRAYMTPGQTFAFRLNPANKTSPILFDTEGLEEWRRKEIKMQQQAIRLRQKGCTHGCTGYTWQ